MEWYTLLFIALGLSMDAFAVSVSNGMCYQNIRLKQDIGISFTFGLFQAIMPALGYLIGGSVSTFVSSVGYWIAFAILAVIGGRMIYGAVKELRHAESCPAPRCYTFRVLLVQAVATSIDALAVGIGFAVVGADIFAAASFIGGITFVCCLGGAFIGKKFGRLLGQKAEIFGGAVLILIGVKMVLEHVLA